MMAIAAHLPAVAALWFVIWVGLYWSYTLLGVEALKPLLDRPRRLAFSAGLVALTIGILVVRHTAGVAGLLAWTTTVPTAVGLLAIVYARRNQWLRPKPAVRLVGGTLEASDDPLVAVLPGGDAVPLGVMRRARTAVTEEFLVVHCGLSRSLAIFERPKKARPAATLPHSTGFTIGIDDQRWDGVNGRSMGKGEDLSPCWVGLCTEDAWRTRHPEAHLLVPEGTSRTAASSGERKPIIPGVRSTEDPSCWGRVQDGRWTALGDEDLQQCPEDESSSPVRYLARWAATGRGLPLS